MFYVIKNKVRNIISGDLAIQLGLLTLRSKATSKVKGTVSGLRQFLAI